MQKIHGTCAKQFERVREAMANNFETGTEQGASVSVTVAGDPVVDLWAGDRNDAGDPWEQDTIANVYSTTKTMSATAMLMLLDRGEIDLDAPVVTYWPEFGVNGKENILIRQVMAHSAGLSGFDPVIEPEALYDEEAVAAGLAAQTPWWEPGSQSGYHAITQGNLYGEIVRQVTGRTIGTFFREEIAQPLSADFHIGLPATEDGRVADLVPVSTRAMGEGFEPGSIAERTMLSCPLTGLEPRTREWRAAEIPAAGGMGNARSVGRVHSMLACGGEVDGVRLMSEATVQRVLEEQSEDVDLVFGMKIKFGLGFGLPNEALPLGVGRRAFFWGGWGGSLALIDLDAQMTVSYVMNKMAPALLGDLRGGLIAMAAYQSLDAGL